MQIDWTIVVAQIVNFAGLVWLLHRFLYEPVFEVIARREAALKERMERAESMQEEARREIAAYEARRQELERTREQYLEDARARARTVLTGLLEEADAEARRARRRLFEQLAAEERELEQALQAGVVEQASRASARLLRSLTGRAVEEGLVDVFSRQLARRVAEDPEAFEAAAPVRGGSPATVRLSFAPDDSQRARLREMLAQAVGRPVAEEDVAFIHDESLVLGVELHLDGFVVSWHARDALADWEADALRRLAREVASDADGGGAPGEAAAGDGSGTGAADRGDAGAGAADPKGRRAGEIR